MSWRDELFLVMVAIATDEEAQSASRMLGQLVHLFALLLVSAHQ